MAATSLSTENRFPDCYRMELEIHPVEESNFINRLQRTDLKQLNLIGNIRFGEHKEEIHYGGGSVSFGIKRGKLTVEITGGEVLLKNVFLKDYLPLEIEVEQQIGISQELNVGAKTSADKTFLASAKAESTSAKKFKIKEHKVKNSGDLKNPSWTFNANSHEKFLQGSLETNTKLAVVDIKSTPCHLITTFN